MLSVKLEFVQIWVARVPTNSANLFVSTTIFR